MNILHVNYTNTGLADGTELKPFPTISQALAAMTGVLGGYVLHVAPGVYIESAALETPAAPLAVYGNGATLIAVGGLTLKGKFINYELTITGTVTLDGGSIDKTVETINAELIEKTPYGVVEALIVSAQSTPDMTVSVSAGVCYMANGDRFALSAVPALELIAAGGTNPRIDIVYVSAAGVITYLAGTAAATPAAPSTPTGGLILAEISVPANDTAIGAAQITDKRKYFYTEVLRVPTFINSWVAETGYAVGYRKDLAGIVRLAGRIKTGTAGTIAFALPTGFRPLQAYSGIANTSGTGVGKVNIATNGEVTIAQLTTYIDLDGIEFYTV